jgi:hypothetical protein
MEKGRSTGQTNTVTMRMVADLSPENASRLKEIRDSVLSLAPTLNEVEWARQFPNT